jgi:hydrogenase maturation protease
MNHVPQTLVIGIGNCLRGDDGVGHVAVQRLRALNLPNASAREESGEGAALIEAWKNAQNVILIDAVQTGAAPGTIYRLGANGAPIPARFFHCSTHGFGVAEAIGLARALDQLPPRLVLYGIEGRELNVGENLSPEVAAAVNELLGRIRQEIEIGS